MEKNKAKNDKNNRNKNNQFKKNLLICGDNLKALDDLKKQDVKADLVYLDPPFFSNRHYEVVWGDEAEVRSFKDRWAGGINVYIGWMKERIIKMYDVLKDTGSFYLHCDWHASHYLKVMCDEVFGYHNFRNEIIWHYRKWSAGFRQFQRNHDIIFFYSKLDSKDRVFNIDYMERTESTLKRFGEQKIVSAYSMNGKRIPSQVEEKKSKGVPRDDVWDIGRVPPIKQLFPTQKPEALLDRIIKASSNKGDIILDPFCGCGTAMVVAQKLERKWIGIDISPTAISLIEKRLGKLGAAKSKDFDTIGMPTTLTELKSLEPFEFQNWIINEMKAKQSKRLVSDMGIDGYYDKTIFTERAGIQVKQSEKVGRNVVDNFETALRRGKYEKGFIVAFSFTRGAHEEVARVKATGLEIKLISVEDLLYGKVKI